jgi:hypothetical protein
VHQVDAEIVHQGSSQAYKSSKHLCIDSGYAVKVPHESVYDADTSVSIFDLSNSIIFLSRV